ncbi:hypothetical protein HDU96_000543 [Phlyctochytrium bullatum]|nr:hypothetical protein HDU96_000543 [Phlyctochytrium bullatum]
MAKKDKKGKGGKGKSRSKKSAKGAAGLPNEQANALLAYLMVDAKEKSVAFYKNWYLQQLRK